MQAQLAQVQLVPQPQSQAMQLQALPQQHEVFADWHPQVQEAPAQVGPQLQLDEVVMSRSLLVVVDGSVQRTCRAAAVRWINDTTWPHGGIECSG